MNMDRQRPGAADWIRVFRGVTNLDHGRFGHAFKDVGKSGVRNQSQKVVASCVRGRPLGRAGLRDGAYIDFCRGGRNIQSAL